MDLIEQCYSYLFWGALVLLGLGLLAVMVYIIRARLTVDRIIGINLIGTLVAIIIAILAYLLGEDYLVLCLNKAHAADIPDWSLTRLLRKMEGPEWN